MRTGLIVTCGMAVLATLGTPAPAAAQTDQGVNSVPTNSRIARKRLSTDNGAWGLDVVARCTVGKYPAMSADALRAPTGSEEQTALLWRTLGKHGESACNTVGDMIITTTELRGAVAAVHYLTQHRTMPAGLGAPATTLPPLKPSIERIMAQPADARPAAVLAEFASCLVMMAPADADAFVRAPLNSDAQQAALDALKPQMPGCAIPDMKLELSIPVLRGHVAYALVRKLNGMGY